MPVLLQHLSVVEKEGPGHAEWITDNPAKAEAADDGGFEPTSPDLPVEYFAGVTAAEPKLAVEARLWIAEARQVTIPPTLEEPLGLLFRSHMNERDPRSCRFDRCPTRFHRGQRLTTEGSAIVAQKDGQNRLAVRHLPQALAILIVNGVDGLQGQLPSEIIVTGTALPFATLSENPV